MPRGRRANGVTESTPEIGDNGPSDALILDYARNIIRKDNEIEEVQASLKSLVGQRRSQVKAAKKAGVPTDALLRAIAQRHKDQDEVIRDEREWVRMRSLLGMPVEQIELFPNDLAFRPVDDEERDKQLAFGAEQLGYVSGKNGNLVDNNPFHQSDESEQYVAWVNGWRRGQAFLAKGLTSPSVRGRRGSGNAEDRPAAQ
jgi:ribosome modulation factor